MIFLFTDTHCHIYSEYYDDIENILKEASINGINRVINNATNIENIKELINLSEKYSNMYVAIGIHPEDIENFDLKNISIIEDYVNNDKVIAIGEIGLDYYYTKENKEQLKNIIYLL